MRAPITTLDALLAPTLPDEFLTKIFARNSLHIRGNPNKFASVMNWDGLNQILGMNIWSAKSFQLVMDTQQVPPPDYCISTVDRNRHQTDQPDPERVIEFLRRGAAFLLNEIDMQPGDLL